MTKDEALRLALEALEMWCPMTATYLNTRDEAITAIREALAEHPAQQKCPGCEGHPAPENNPCAVCGKPAQHQEPVAWRNAALRVGEDLCSVGPFGYYDMAAEQWLDWALSVVTVHAPPASKPWVGLTDEEFQFIYATGNTPAGMMEMVEAKLKEKNA